ncbi:hypothetical protein KC332_g10155 [Hortaea werneckii]|nr:hypothetical protein KC358_g15837 [Hortaea werneckii]KAI6812513.1 hypothetical protein KC350_g11865 [Hortaea werneckii]KAI6830591.1 hypothetical protein KC342_g8362 [Hortaea werneckii]KAI6903277.1 hypothetical protein KC348_g15733 [Hortaea werneckii]KAI6922042.1 hypothetical protein KC341_g15602 [Hortaea werneckii]
MSGYIKGSGEARPPLPITRIFNGALQNYRFQIGAIEAAMNHPVLDAHSQRHPVLGGEGPPQHQQDDGHGPPGDDDANGDDGGNEKDKHDDHDHDANDPEETPSDDPSLPNNLPNNNVNLPNANNNNLTPPSPFVRGHGHDPYGHFAAAAEAKRRRAAKKARVLARREVGRLRKWEEWRKGVWEPLVPPA